MPYWPNKDPDEVTDFDINWTKRLDGDTIVSSAWTVVNGTVVINSDSESATLTKVWLSGGTLGETCELRNRITTAGGRTYDQTVLLKIRKR